MLQRRRHPNASLRIIPDGPSLEMNSNAVYGSDLPITIPPTLNACFMDDSFAVYLVLQRETFPSVVM